MSKAKKALKVVSVLGMLLIPFPILMCGFAARYNILSITLLAIIYAIGGAVCFIGWLMKSLLSRIGEKRKKSYGWFRVLTWVLAIIIAVIPMFFGDGRTLSFFCISLALFMPFCYYLGFRLFKTDFTEVFSVVWLAIYILDTIFMFFMFNSMATGDFLFVGRELIIATALIVTLIAVILANQTNLTNQVNRRHDTAALVPKNLRSYNLWLITILTLVFGAIFIFRQPIADAIGAFFKMILNIIINLFHMNDTEPITDYDSGGELGTVSQQVSNEYIPYLLYIVAIIAVLFVLIKFRDKIWESIKNAIKSFIAFINRNKDISDKEPEPYRDYFEAVTYSRGLRRSDRITLKDCLRLYHKEKQPIMKLRLGYRCMLLFAVGYRVDLKESDTVEQQTVKARSLFGDEEKSDEIKDMYNSLRYGEKQADERSMEVMEEIVSKIEH